LAPRRDFGPRKRLARRRTRAFLNQKGLISTQH
jgi:hypothetical protein